MDPSTFDAFLDELMAIEGSKVAALRIKSNDRMPPKTKANMLALAQDVVALSKQREESGQKAVEFAKKVGPETLFDILHGMRRWYSGGTMQHKLLEHNEHLKGVMELKPADVMGVYRGFKVDKSSPLARSEPGQQLVLDVTRNGGFSSWTTTEAPAHKFSGGGAGKVGLVIKLVDTKDVKPVLAPPERTTPWFNALYEKAIGKSFRPTEGEYLIHAPSVKVEVVRVKK